ncbi:uncharacterized protein [Typha angustifolia]|uniref:uncharacterized protein n=1 Tax=Typha angustifolia TaxID=59011 RepID=UPI003C2F25F4
MATMSLTASLSMFAKLRLSMAIRSPCYPRSFVTAASRPLQASAEVEAKETHKNIKDAANEVKKTAEDIREKVNVAADEVIDKTIEAAGTMIGRANNHGGKAKETVQDAWGSTKETFQKVKDTVAGNGEEAKAAAKPAI